MTLHLNQKLPSTETSSLEQLAALHASKSGDGNQRLNRWFQIVSHYSWPQMARRATNLAHSRLRPSRRVGSIEVGAVGSLKENSLATQLARTIASHAADHPSHQNCDLDTGHFELLHQPITLGNPLNWQSPLLKRQPHLWRFQLHYHEFLLNQVSQKRWQSVAAFLRDWLDNHSPDQTLRRDDAWHPYCISRRIVAWTWLLYLSDEVESGVDSGLSSSLIRQLYQSIQQQAQYLAANLEKDLGGNHLLENATALAIAGSSFDCEQAERWQSLAAQILQAELSKQVLESGEHFELSPVYHCQILSNLLRIKLCSQPNTRLNTAVSKFIQPMLKFLSSILHPDGEVPLFGDSVFFESPSVAEIESVARLCNYDVTRSTTTPEQVRDSNYWRVDSKHVTAIVDFGPIAAKRLPAHGHCDAMGLELSVQGNRWFIDSGNYNYQDDSMRHYCRSSMAHNVATIDQQNQASVWSKFRMGYRPKVTARKTGKQNGWNWCTAVHDGYKKLAVPSMRRVVASQNGAFACLDSANSRDPDRPRQLVGFLHLHPDVIIQQEPATAGLCHFRLRNGATTRRLTVSASETSLETGWYCPQFGLRTPSTVLRYSRPVTEKSIAWILSDTDRTCKIRCAADQIEIMISGMPDFVWKENTRAASSCRTPNEKP